LHDKEMWNDTDFSDCRIVCSGRVFPCHRVVLASASPVWRAALLSGFKESFDARIDIEDAEPIAVEALLSYIYNGVLDQDHAADVLPLAHRYQIHELIKVCASSILKNINQQNVVDVVSVMREFTEHEEVSAVWPSVVEKVCADPVLRDTAMRRVRPERRKDQRPPCDH